MQHHIFSFPFYTQLPDDFILSRFCVSSNLGLGQYKNPPFDKHLIANEYQ